MSKVAAKTKTDVKDDIVMLDNKPQRRHTATQPEKKNDGPVMPKLEIYLFRRHRAVFAKLFA